ncbi:MAG: hypothetical protein M3O50_02590 [Myxococcota bacterium]|nr:hypothetical protein [Myxococcota bacterium]
MRADRATRTRPGASARDQHESPFASILAVLVERIPGARAAALVDSFGETVDYAGGAPPFDLRLSAAHWRIVLDAADGQRSFQGLRWFAVRASKRSYLVYALPDGYALVIALSRAAGFAGWQRAVSMCVRALSKEAGLSWMLGVPSAAWFPIDVLSDTRRRPCSVRIEGRLYRVEILGTIARSGQREARASAWDPAGRERGWRVRLDTGVEATLIREPGGTWYADDPMDRGCAKETR